MTTPEQFVTENLDVWTNAIKPKSSVGRGRGKGRNGKHELYGLIKLRELILELAVRGLLVPQDPKDEPARELLKNIATEKAKLIKEKKIKKQKTLAQISDDEKPFELPQGWEWARLQDVGHDLGQTKPDQDFTYIDVGSINKVLGHVESPSILSANEAPSRARKLVKNGTVIYSTVRPYLLNIAIIDKDFEPKPIASTAFSIIHPLNGINGSFVYRYLRSPIFVKYVESVQTGIAYPAINDKQFFSGLIPLAPTNEQHRIIAKVDELMALCDQLEQKTETSLAAHQTLVETVLAALTRTSGESDINAEAIFFQHFGTLFTTENSIDQLKETILQLAVMGKLATQNPSDEPASKLLKKIAVEKAKLIEEKKIKKQNPVPPIGEDEKPFELPVGWEWVRLQNITSKITDGDHQTPPRIESGRRLLSAKNVRNGFLDYENCDYISEADYIKSRERCLPEPGNLLIVSVGGTIGRSSLVPEDSDFSLVRSVALIKPLLFNSKFLKYSADSPLLQNSIHTNKRGGAQPCLYLSVISKFPFPMPPLEEQHRIVTKVDELMALCDQLKHGLTSAKTTQLHLADTIVEKALG